jgi:hypothetical protein
MQLSVVKDLVSSMDLMVGAVDEDGQPMEALQPKMTFNPVTQRIYQCLQHRALNPDEPLPELDVLVDRSVRPQELLLRQIEPVAERLRNSFPLVRHDATQRPKGFFSGLVCDGAHVSGGRFTAVAQLGSRSRGHGRPGCKAAARRAPRLRCCMMMYLHEALS